MTQREVLGHALDARGPLCARCLSETLNLPHHERVMTLLRELEETGHVERERTRCPRCDQMRVVAKRTAKDLRERPPSPRRGDPTFRRVESVLVASNPAVVPGSFRPDPKTGIPTVTARCLYPGCTYRTEIPFNRLGKHLWCSKHAPVAPGEAETPDFEARRSLKFPWRGRIRSIQPRIRLSQSFDEAVHSYLGYVLEIEGTVGLQTGCFGVAIGEAAQEKFGFSAGDEVQGRSSRVETPTMETADYYKTSGLEVLARSPWHAAPSADPPFHGVAPPIENYRARGHRRLEAGRYEEKCASCLWGCKMPVEIIRDSFNRSRGPDNVSTRMETFCYGPDECPFYKAGPMRKVRGRRGMVHDDDGDTRKLLRAGSLSEAAPRGESVTENRARNEDP